MKALFFENSLSKIMALKVASRFNRLAALSPLSPLQFSDITEPQLPNSRWVKVKNQACGLCGTDIHFMFMEMDPGCFPAALPGIRRKFLGHEVLSHVVEAGSDSGFAVGDRVVMRLDWPSCAQLELNPVCGPCASGNYMLCENLGKASLPLQDVGVGFSPYMVMHRSQPFGVPPELSDDHALLIEPTACAVHGVRKALPEAHHRVLVIGGGTIGLLTVAVLRKLVPDAQLDCYVRYPYQGALAQKLGAHPLQAGSDAYENVAHRTGARALTGHLGNRIVLGGYDVIFDTVGNDASLHDALRWVRGQGQVVLMGINFQPTKVDYTTIWNQEIRLTGINCHATESDGRTSFEHAAELLANGVVDPSLLLTHRLPVQRWKDAVRLFLNKSGAAATKIVLTHDVG